jgi:hypothetical protein
MPTDGYDVRRLKLRKLELQMHYHAAYQFWNLKGVIAEKWGHGPHFGAYSESSNEVRLTVAAGKPSPLVGVYGLRVSAFGAEHQRFEDASGLAVEWMSDCLETLRPILVNRLVLRLYYAYPVHDAQRVSQALASEYPGVEQLWDSEAYDTVHGGLQSQQIRSLEDGGQKVTSVIFGAYSPNQQREWFNVVDAYDGPWTLGFHYFQERRSSDAGFSDRQSEIDQLIKEARAESWSWARSHVARVVNRSYRTHRP